MRSATQPRRSDKPRFESAIKPELMVMPQSVSQSVSQSAAPLKRSPQGDATSARFKSIDKLPLLP